MLTRQTLSERHTATPYDDPDKRELPERHPANELEELHGQNYMPIEPDVPMLDIEGFEIAGLAGARRLIQRKRDLVLDLA